MKSTDLLTALLARLALIRKSAGYQTDAGLRVYRTLIGMPVPENLTLPALFVRLDDAGLPTLNKLRRLDTVSTLTVTVEGAVAVTGTTPVDASLLALLYDIRAALLAEDAFTGLLHGLDSLTFDSARFQLPDGGNALATVSQPLTLTYSERYTPNL